MLASQLNKDCKTELNNMAIIQSFDLVVFGFWGYNYFKEQSKSVPTMLTFNADSTVKFNLRLLEALM